MRLSAATATSSPSRHSAIATWVRRTGSRRTCRAEGAAVGSTKLLSAPGAVYSPYYNPAYETPPDPFFAFTSDLSQALFNTYSVTPLVAGEPANSNNLYEQSTASGADNVLTTLPSGAKFAGPDVAGASPDLQHVVFDTDGGGGDYYNIPLDAQIPNQAVYEWSADQGMSLASILPDGHIANNAVAGSGPLAPIEIINDASYISLYHGDTPNVISNDGTRLFFTDEVPNGTRVDGNLFQRRDQGLPDASTVQIDAPAAGVVYNNYYVSKFVMGSASGHQALFLSCAPLTSNSTAQGSNGSTFSCETQNDNRDDSTNLPGSSGAFVAKNDLYLYDEDANGGAGGLTDISIGDPTGANVLGVLGASSDLSRVYFAATGNLTGTVPSLPGACHTPADQQANLYVWDKTDGIRYITTLAEPTEYNCNDAYGDIPDWEVGIDSLHKEAQVSPDGRYLAFASESGVIDPSFNNQDSDTSLLHQEVYEYDYNANATPTCVSCIGGPPTTDSTIASNELSTQETDLPGYAGWQKQNLLSNGTLFFESGEKLVAADDSTSDNVYEYKPFNGHGVVDLERAVQRAVAFSRRDRQWQRRVLLDRPVVAGVGRQQQLRRLRRARRGRGAEQPATRAVHAAALCGPAGDLDVRRPGQPEAGRDRAAPEGCRVLAGALDIGAGQVAREDRQGHADDHRAWGREGVGEGARAAESRRRLEDDRIGERDGTQSGRATHDAASVGRSTIDAQAQRPSRGHDPGELRPHHEDAARHAEASIGLCQETWSSIITKGGAGHGGRRPRIQLGGRRSA